ncbi:MAG: hypothetical protein Kow0027_25290 [Saprospiraceae bacterium]
MRNLILLGFFLSYPLWLSSQVQNISLIGHLSFDSKANDIWGYTAPDGTEYALVGLRSGVSIVSLADPANPTEVAFIEGEESVWRDLRTRGHYCYVVTDQPGTKEGFTIIDLSGLPASVDYHRVQPWLPEFGDTLFTSHNIWIDEFGYAYLSGGNVNSGGVVFFDLFSDPDTPKYVGKGFPVGSHDCFARNNTLYVAEILAGQFAIYDVSDKANVQLLATQETPFRFSHNVWPSDDGKFLFNTDERANAPVAAYSIWPVDNIQLLDEFTPPATRGTGVIPHNVHFLNDYLVISYYTDGCIIVDASDPAHLVQVGWYDTNQDYTGGYHGAWGAYPYFPSGLIVISDIENGLFVLQPEYKRACRLTGGVVDAVTGSPIAQAKVEILSGDPNATTTANDGSYKTGQPTAGTFTVRASAIGYFDQERQVELINGELSILNFSLEPTPSFKVEGTVREAFSGQPIEGVRLAAESEHFSYNTTSAADGTFSFFVKQGEYNVYAGKWGYSQSAAFQLDLTEKGATLDFTLYRGYSDNFNLDLGWTVNDAATDGNWERGIPKGTISGGFVFNPFEDSPNDEGAYAWVSGNQGLIANDDDLDGGPAVLTSPPMALASCYGKPMLYYESWFFEPREGFPGNDTLVISISNGEQETVVEMLNENVQDWRPSGPIDIAELIPVTDNMRLIVSASDYNPEYDFLEVGFDNFQIRDANGWPACSTGKEVELEAWPNPFTDELHLRFLTELPAPQVKIRLLNTLGQDMGGSIEGNFTAFGEIIWKLKDLANGLYLVQVIADGKIQGSVKVVKQ